MKRQAAAPVTPVRQRTQYSCMSTSMMMCLRATGTDTNEDEVNRVMGAKPMQGATWEDAIACAQHYGKRVHLICPATVRQLKEFTDRGIPVMIAWNPEGRDWSHASVVFDVDDDLNVHVADPNIPDPDETVRVVAKGDFYHKWFEKWPNYLVRRPAMAIEPEISEDGRQMVASECSPENNPFPASEQEVARWYVRATEELHLAMLNILGADEAASATRRSGIEDPFSNFVDAADESYPFGGTLAEMVKRTGGWRDDVRAKFDAFWSGCYEKPHTARTARRVAARFVSRKAEKS